MCFRPKRISTYNNVRGQRSVGGGGELNNYFSDL